MTKLERLLMFTLVAATLFNTYQINAVHQLMVAIAESLNMYSAALYQVWRVILNV